MNKTARKQNFHWLQQQGKANKIWLYRVISLSCLNGLILILQAWFLALWLDTIVIHQRTLSLAQITVWLFLFSIALRAGVLWLREYCSSQTSAQVRLKIRNELFSHLLKVSPVHLHNQNIGRISGQLMEQIDALHGFFADYLPHVYTVIFIPFAILMFVFSQSWLAGLILLITAPLIPLFMMLIGMGVESVNQKHFQSLFKLGSVFLDSLRGLKTLKLFEQTDHQKQKLTQATKEYRLRTMAVLKVAFLSSAILELFSSVAIAMVAIYLGLALLGFINIGIFGEISLHKAAFILLLAPEFYLPLRQLAVHYHSKAEAVAASNDLIKLSQLPIHQPATTEQDGEAKIRVDLVSEIEVNNLCFSYHGTQIIFENFSLKIQQGQHIGISGDSGIGKSTLVNLLSGYMHPDSGTIRINQHDLKNINLQTWWSQLSLLQQTPQLFSGSIQHNLLIAKPSASEEEIYQALKKAQIDDFVQQLPEKLDTLIGEQNARLSGGQAQRIALARIFLADRPILLLDEPTASLDKHTELSVLSAIKKHCMDKTIIMVSHRVQALAMMDEIIQL